MGNVSESRPRRKTMARIKPSVVAVYVSVFALIVAVISVGYHQPQESSSVVGATNANAASSQTSVDNVVAASVAADVAQATDMPIANNVANLAVSAKITSELAQSSETSMAKPQIIESSGENRSVIKYTVKSGDTVGSLSDKFGISAQTIKWANDLTTDDLVVGKVLRILPFNGVLYTVKSGDTIDSIAKKYSVDKTRLILNNDLDVSVRKGLTTGMKIILPSATLPTDERPGYVAPVVYVPYLYNVAYGYSGGDVTYLNVTDWNNYCGMSSTIKNYLPGVSSLCNSSDGNTMGQGQCTWWAWERRKAIGRPLPSYAFGNAFDWTRNLQYLFGYHIDSTPQSGDVFQGGNHVGIVESVNKDNDGRIVSFTTSEMNYPYTSFQVVSRIISADNFNNFNFIH